MNKINILVMLPETKKGGPYNSQKRIIESPLRDHYKFSSIYIPRLRNMIKPYVFLSLVHKIRKANPKIIHLYGLQIDGFIMMLLAIIAFRKRPRVLVIRGSSKEAIDFNKIKKWGVGLLEAWTVKHSTILYGVSNYVLSWKVVKRYSTECFGRIFNYSSLYNMPFLTKSKEELRVEFRIPLDAIVIISTGRITIEKGFKNLMKVITNNDWSPNVFFMIVGDGEYLLEFKKSIFLSKMHNRVLFTGYSNDINRLLGISDIFVICTKHETLCNSIIEAGTFGLPVVATNVGGIPEIIEDAVDGFLYNVNDDLKCAEKLKELILNEKLRKSMSKNILNNVNEKVNEMKISVQLDQVYHNAMNHYKKSKNI